MTDKTKIGLLICFTLAIQLGVFVDISISKPMINNGDYWRVTRGLIDFAPWSPIHTCLEYNFKSRLPGSTLGVFFIVSVWIAELFSAECFNLSVYFTALYFVFLSGCLFALYINRANLVPIFLCSIIAVLFSSFFLSFYEEIAVLIAVPWLIGGYSIFAKKGGMTCFVFSACCILFAKVQMAILLPLLLYLVFDARKNKTTKPKVLLFGAAVLIASSAAAFNAKAGNKTPNSYNRLYNGIGWSLLGVTSWDKATFSERHHFFYTDRPTLESGTRVTNLPPELLPLLGTSFWPTGSDIFSNKQDFGVDKSQLEASLKPSFYLKLLFADGIFPKFLTSVYSLTFQSQYSVSYLLSEGERERRFSITKTMILGWAGLAFFTLTILGLLRKEPIAYLAAVLSLSMPLVVVLGDGFYEFEKHMVPFFMALPIIFIPVRKQFEQNILNG